MNYKALQIKGKIAIAKFVKHANSRIKANQRIIFLLPTFAITTCSIFFGFNSYK